MKGLPNRIVIHSHDVCHITGRSERGARKLLQDIRRKYRRPKMEFVSLEDFCAYTGLREEEVVAFLK